MKEGDNLKIRDENPFQTMLAEHTIYTSIFVFLFSIPYNSPDKVISRRFYKTIR